MQEHQKYNSIAAVHQQWYISSAVVHQQYSGASAVHQQSSSMTYLQPRVMVAINGLKLHNAYSWT